MFCNIACCVVIACSAFVVLQAAARAWCVFRQWLKTADRISFQLCFSNSCRYMFLIRLKMNCFPSYCLFYLFFSLLNLFFTSPTNFRFHLCSKTRTYSSYELVISVLRNLHLYLANILLIFVLGDYFINLCTQRLFY